MSSSLVALLSRGSKCRALVVGDLMLDEYAFCTTSASKPIPSEKEGKRAYTSARNSTAPGGAANVAVNLRSLGVSVALVGVVGRDGYDAQLRRQCEDFGIIPAFLPDPTRPTTTKKRIYIDDEYFFRLDNEVTSDISPALGEFLVEECRRRLDEVDVVVLSDYDKGVFTESTGPRLVEECRVRGIPVVVDCKPANAELFVGSHLIIWNLLEARSVLPDFALDARLEERLRFLHRKLGATGVAVTLGEKGVCGDDGRSFVKIDGMKVDARDCVGAGDTVRAAVALGAALKLPFRQVLELANVAGALVVQKVGTAHVTLAEILEALRDEDGLGQQAPFEQQAAFE